MYPKVLILHMPPHWLPETKILVLEMNADGEDFLALMPVGELRRRFKTDPNLSGSAAVLVFETFRQDIEADIRALLERHGRPPGGRVPGPRVLNLAAPSAPWCLPTAAIATDAR